MPRILLVEDNEMNRDMLSRRLGRRGFDVHIATDGLAGVQRALAERFDLILMDMGLPELDGWEATRRIRQSPDNHTVPIIALTAHAMAGDRDRALDAGCDDYDTKPVDIDRLLGKIDGALARKRPASPPPRVLSPDEIGDLRHELRTPLNLIIGYGEMLLEDAGPASPRHDSLTAILTEGRAALDLVGSQLSPALVSIGTPQLAALADTLRAPHDRILAAVGRLRATVSNDEPQLAADLDKIGHAADRLLDVALGVAHPGGATAEPQSVTPQPRAPAAQADSTAENVLHAASTAETAPSAGAAPARLLVVDDLEDNRLVLERRLRRQGHDVTCANGGLQALELLSRERFDLVLLDVMMPDLDGLAVLQRIKASPDTRDIPVIMISALDDVGTVVRCIEHGAEDHLPKPFDPTLLRARVNASLEKKRLRDAELEYLEQVRVLTDAALAVERGTYEVSSLANVARRADELGRLARVFDTMVANVRAREDRLREQLDALKQEIEAAEAVATRSHERVPHALPTGQLFANRYEIIELTGVGGMGIVYRAHDRHLGETVAIKTLRGELTLNAEAIDRFKQEIRLARHISHRNVVRLHDLGECDGVYYITMEYVEGITVRQLLRTRGQLGVPATLAVGRQIAESLLIAHEEGIIHRDIKPENLLLGTDGALKVMDFGVARLAEGATVITTAGAIVGTPAYMAPEQLLAEDIDPRSDLYSLGVVLYECLTGALPFDAPSPFALIAHILRDEPRSPSARQAGIPALLDQLVLRLLAKEPDARPSGATDVVKLLAEIG